MKYRPTTFNVVHHGVRANDVSIFQFTPQNAIFIPSSKEQNKKVVSLECNGYAEAQYATFAREDSSFYYKQKYHKINSFIIYGVFCKYYFYILKLLSPLIVD